MKKVYIYLILTVVILLGIILIADSGGEEPLPEGPEVNIKLDSEKETQKEPKTNMKKVEALMKTNFGDIKLQLFPQYAPKTVQNFVKLSDEDFYQETKFHRVIKGFMIQGGDPLTKDDSQKEKWGRGGPGYTFEDEIHENNKNKKGTIAMANSGPDTNGSQFFINTADNHHLDQKHTVFGKVIDAMNVVKDIEKVETEGQGRPVESVVIEDVEIIN